MRIYLLLSICALIMGAYFYGTKVEKAKCESRNLQNNLQNIEKIQQTQRMVHETSYKTGVDDIRIILLNKYTIAE
nr:hypothetical protein [Candidatus Enterousia merdequi]